MLAYGTLIETQMDVRTLELCIVGNGRVEDAVVSHPADIASDRTEEEPQAAGNVQHG